MTHQSHSHVTDVEYPSARMDCIEETQSRIIKLLGELSIHVLSLAALVTRPDDGRNIPPAHFEHG
jgi:hypothetical protein